MIARSKLSGFHFCQAQRDLNDPENAIIGAFAGKKTFKQCFPYPLFQISHVMIPKYKLTTLYSSNTLRRANPIIVKVSHQRRFLSKRNASPLPKNEKENERGLVCR